MASTKSPIDSLKELNLKRVLQIDELGKENAEVKAENTSLKQAIEENFVIKIRFEELEKKIKQIPPDLLPRMLSLKTESRNWNRSKPESLLMNRRYLIQKIQLVQNYQHKVLFLPKQKMD